MNVQGQVEANRNRVIGAGLDALNKVLDDEEKKKYRDLVVDLLLHHQFFGNGINSEDAKSPLVGCHDS